MILKANNAALLHVKISIYGPGSEGCGCSTRTAGSSYSHKMLANLASSPSWRPCSLHFFPIWMALYILVGQPFHDN